MRLRSYPVMRLRGNRKFEFAIAAPTRSLPSFTAPLGQPDGGERREAVGDVGLDVYEIDLLASSYMQTVPIHAVSFDRF